MTDTTTTTPEPRKKHLFQPGQSGNPAGRPPGTTSIHKMREIVGKEGYEQIISVLKEKALEGDSQAANILLTRLTPAVKPAPAPVVVELRGDTVSERCESVIDQMTAGNVSIEQGRLLLESLVDLSQLRELERLNKRLDVLEASR